MSEHGLPRWILAIALLLGAVIAGGYALAPARPEPEVLNVYNWSDYLGDDTVANFERETGITVHYDTFDTNETLHAKLLVGHSGYDIVVPSSNWAHLQLQGGLLTPLDRSRIANYGNLDPRLMHKLETTDPGNRYLVPWVWGITTVGVNAGRLRAALGDLPMPENAWDLVFQPRYAERAAKCGISMLDSADEVFPAALRYLGKSPATTATADYEAAAALLERVRPYVSLFSSSGYINDLAGGSLCVVLGWNGDINIARQRAREAGSSEDIRVLLPSSGAVLFFDTMAIPADAPHKDNAYKWINYILRPDVNAAIVNKVLYANPVPAAASRMRADVRDNPAIFLSEADMARMVPPQLQQSGEVRRVRTRLFTRFKTGL